MKYLLTSALFIVGLFFSGCSDSTVSSSDFDLSVQEFNSEAEMRAPSPGNQTIADIVVTSASADEDAEFTLLLAALEYTGLTDVFTGNDQYTVFAPVDQAFLNLVDELSDNLDQDILENEGPFAAIDELLGEDAVANVLLYHVTEGRRAANSVVPRNMRAKERKINTLLDDASFYVAFGGIITDIAGQEVSITAADISASNGIIHVIDTVLLPLE